ncbi:SPOR domain-containing protein [Alloalcanivorax gelatiniphagus]|uniref:SPOR domain-containing protein n=1 Tax=Alloalcanivorax gelatiniphagus TaxID=1194167 RepID=A0ABY2XNR1_9GAMM|nr:SPOR domain-containing protein [Alloalcanivorax gelatiniphagus]TMW14096.1 SPOR domain-containing protein [Alloalcanivorax gelatiniphagus]|tara:strand:- start:994 stop:1608 length:615 start_codon:yes stop_codon:yes gene_type:complete
MHVKTRQRLIGLLLLLLLAAILAPLVLRTPDQVRVALDMSIPEPPPVSEPEVAPVVSEEERAATDDQIDEERQAVLDAGERALSTPEQPKQPAAQPKTAEPEPAPPAAVAPAKDSSPDIEDGPAPAFTVQVASFSDAGNAEALVKRLRGSGYNAYHRTVSQDNNTWERVFVGPEVRRADADALRQRLAADKTFALDGLVRPFVP